MRWVFQTRRGLAEIVPRNDGWFTLVFDGEALESHHSAPSATEALAGGTCAWPSAGNPAEFGIPEELGEWTKLPS